MVFFWPVDRGGGVKVKIWGARGSIPAPGPETTRYGGNTSCVQLTLSDGSLLVLDAGTGIRNLGIALRPSEQPVHILLTHLHLDHIQGLMFFPPLFRPESQVVIWGPASPEASLRDRIGRYISAPLTPVEVRELPCQVSFREAETTEWRIGPARIRAASVSHRGPTPGIPRRGRWQLRSATSLTTSRDWAPRSTSWAREWISGFDLARESTLLIHDRQYTDDEYPEHLGWGHSSLSDALVLGQRTGTERLLLFHHDPLHSDDFLDVLSGEAAARWQDLGGRPDQVELATERRELELRAGAVVPDAGEPWLKAKRRPDLRDRLLVRVELHGGHAELPGGLDVQLVVVHEQALARPEAAAEALDREPVDLGVGLAHPDPGGVDDQLEDLVERELASPELLPFAHVVGEDRHPVAPLA